MSFKFFMTNYYNSVLITFILETIVCGIYTLLWGYTVWRLLLRKSRYSYVLCLTILWLFTISTLLLDWREYQKGWWPHYAMVPADAAYVADVALVYSQQVWVELNLIFSILVMMIADTLLIYRCYNVCGRKKWILASLGPLLCTDIVGTCAEFFRFANHKNNTGGDTYRLFKLNYFILGFLAFSIIITGVSTSLIILRILSATQGNPAIGSRAPYQKIQCIIIASGAIYLFGLVITVIPLALVSYMASAPQTRFYSPAFVPSSIILMYSQPLLIPLAGISPTLIALRVITQKPEAESDDSPPTSRLTFRRTIQRTHTPAIGSLVSSLHFESTWEAEDLVTGTSCMADGDDGITVEGLDGGEQIRLQKA